VFITLMGLERAIGLPAEVFYPIRFVAAGVALSLVSRRIISWRPSYPLASAGMGVAVFLVWIAPDALFGYRHFWLFENALTGKAISSMKPALMHNAGFLVIRTLGSMVLVPILEELFWRGWLMRWLINKEFLKVPLGQYAGEAFWLTAILFGSEHGPYWEVGIAAGIAYNWWVIRTRNLADCMIAHGVTNGVLSVYVILWGQWQYWP
jgi:CAAX prenyl protease-like protein